MKGGGGGGAEGMYNDQLSTACGRLQAPLIQERLSFPINDAEGRGRVKKPCPTPHGWASRFTEDLPTLPRQDEL